MIRRPPRSTPLYSSAASDVYKRQALTFFMAYSSFNGYLLLYITSLTHALLFLAQTKSCKSSGGKLEPGLAKRRALFPEGRGLGVGGSKRKRKKKARGNKVAQPLRQAQGPKFSCGMLAFSANGEVSRETCSKKNRHRRGSFHLRLSLTHLAILVQAFLR